MCAHPRALTLRLLCFPLPAQPTFQKNTNVWSDHKDTVEIFVQQDGKTMKKECDHTKGQVCPFYKMHANLRPGKGEKGRAMHPSSQAAAWVVLFPRVGKRLRVIPEPLLRIVGGGQH